MKYGSFYVWMKRSIRAHAPRVGDPGSISRRSTTTLDGRRDSVVQVHFPQRPSGARLLGMNSPHALEKVRLIEGHFPPPSVDSLGLMTGLGATW